VILFHAHVHVTRYRELIAMKPLTHEQPPEPITVECPRCGEGSAHDRALEKRLAGAALWAFGCAVPLLIVVWR
jgi:hypothetical protein